MEEQGEKMLFKVRWEQNGTTTESDHTSYEGASKKARDRSKVYGRAMIAEVYGGKKLGVIWTYVNGGFEAKDRSRIGWELPSNGVIPESPESQGAAEASLPSGAPVAGERKSRRAPAAAAAAEDAPKARKVAAKVGKTAPASQLDQADEVKEKTMVKVPRKGSKAAEKSEQTERIVSELAARPGSLRDVLGRLLAEEFGQPVKETDLMTKLYGEASSANRGAMMMVLKGIKKAIADNDLPYEVRLERIEKVPHIILAFR